MAFKYVLLATLLAVAHAGVYLPPTAAKPDNMNADDFDANPKYTFNYAISDSTTGDNHKHEETLDEGTVRGSYSLIEADGRTRIVDYTADDVNGFNAVVRHEGTANVAPEAPVKVVAPVKVLAPAPVKVVAPVKIVTPVVHKVVAPAYSSPIVHYAPAISTASYHGAAATYHAPATYHAAPATYHAAPATYAIHAAHPYTAVHAPIASHALVNTHYTSPYQYTYVH